MTFTGVVVVGLIGAFIGLLISWPIYRFMIILDKRRAERGAVKNILEKEQILNIGDKSFRIDKFSTNTGKDLRSKKVTILKKQVKDGLKDVEDKQKEKLKKESGKKEVKLGFFKKIFKRGAK